MPSMGRRKRGGVAGPTNLSDLPHSSHPEYPAERVHVASEFRKTKTSLPQGGEVFYLESAAADYLQYLSSQPKNSRFQCTEF